MITYRVHHNGNVNVYLEGRRVGTIRIVCGGYAYFPYRSDEHGDVFKSIGEVKKSLESG